MYNTKVLVKTGASLLILNAMKSKKHELNRFMPKFSFKAVFCHFIDKKKAPFVGA
jgi:hypothetical protein